MAVLTGNNPALTIDAVDVTADFIDVSIERTAPSIDITAGGGATHMERDFGLLDTKMSVTLAYDTTTVDTNIPKFNPQAAYAIVYGPEGSSAGDPKHDQSFVCVSSSMTGQNVAKGRVVFELSFEGAAVPTTDFFNGGTY